MNKQRALEYIQALPDDEPVLLFRGQDKLATLTGTCWLALANTHGVNEHKISCMAEEVNAMQDWQFVNLHTTKLPD